MANIKSDNEQNIPCHHIEYDVTADVIYITQPLVVTDDQNHSFSLL